MQKLTSLSEQLKQREINNIKNILNAVANNKDGIQNKDYLEKCRKLKEKDTRLTEALNEAKDNVKYLSTLEKFIDPLYHGNPETIKDSLPALMNSIKMIHTIAR
jgi:dynein heavy chain